MYTYIYIYMYPYICIFDSRAQDASGQGRPRLAHEDLRRRDAPPRLGLGERGAGGGRERGACQARSGGGRGPRGRWLAGGARGRAGGRGVARHTLPARLADGCVRRRGRVRPGSRAETKEGRGRVAFPKRLGAGVLCHAGETIKLENT